MVRIKSEQLAIFCCIFMECIIFFSNLSYPFHLTTGAYLFFSSSVILLETKILESPGLAQSTLLLHGCFFVSSFSLMSNDQDLGSTEIINAFVLIRLARDYVRTFYEYSREIVILQFFWNILFDHILHCVRHSLSAEYDRSMEV